MMARTCLFHISGNEYPSFPAEHHTLRIWEELAQGFDEYHVFARHINNRYDYSSRGNIHLHLVPACGRSISVFFFLSWVLPYFVWRYRPTHLLAQCPVVGGLSAAFCAWFFKIPLLVELHGDHYFFPSRGGLRGKLEFYFYRYLSPITFAVAKKIRSLSQDMTSHIAEAYGNTVAKKISCIPVRVDVSVFECAARNYTMHEPIRVVMVGSLFPRKNQAKLIEHLAELNVACELTLVGDGPLMDSYRALGDKYANKLPVNLLGNKSHVQLGEILAEQDIYVHYSLAEGTPRAVLEAMAAGLPVITTKAGFMQGILRHEENSMLLLEPSLVELGGALEKLISSPDLRMKIGKNGKKLIKDVFEWHKVFDLYRSEILSMKKG